MYQRDAVNYNKFPDIELYKNGDVNPTLISPNSPFTSSFYSTRETLFDVENYRAFINNVKGRFRRSITYKHYKSYLIGMGLDHCQIHGNINSEMAEIEMHHHILTLDNICILITEHILNTIGYVSTYDVIQLLKEEHKANRIAIVMLAKTPHQVYTENPDFFIHPSMTFGKWNELLEKYKYGITQDIAFKVLMYLKKALETDSTDDNGLLELRDNIMNWSGL